MKLLTFTEDTLRVRVRVSVSVSVRVRTVFSNLSVACLAAFL